ncbi:CoA-transferase family III domain-containing protein [Cokeromyces recurvatus]|uniref:CoA-transferase family III domain-containing protein n=1 Tax=Cokeromyces recurvatus TaxID=90255 RepID=UPI00221ED628|nr:CoA-transferase family III domain-containing protein [Cokeromyces recurvatus]KAI7902663.1 CoA-transferase family III domain-containing protein [Cokeromyces recurvatus]
MSDNQLPPLSDIVVFEMAGLAPAPFAGLVLSDFGANVIRIDRPRIMNTDVLNRNKRSIALDLKNPLAIHTLLYLLKQADVLLDPFRPGVMEKLGLGPQVLLTLNPRLIYARLSGYGQSGPMSQIAGHDINYLAISGALSLLGRQGEKPFFPVNILADFAGGGLMCVMGILMALIERSKSGKGQVIDANLTLGTSYLTTFPYLMQKHGLMWEGERGTNLLDGGAHFYEVYKTKDNQHMAVGAIEPQFYACLLEKLNLKTDELPNQMDRISWPEMKIKFQHIFSTKTQQEWISIFEGSDACVTPVLSFNHKEKEKIAVTATIPQPAPILSRTPAKRLLTTTTTTTTNEFPFLESGKHSIDILTEFGINSNQITKLLASNAVVDNNSKL